MALPAGNTGKPSFALPLLEIFEHAWTLGSLNFDQQLITSGMLFIAALEKGQGTFTESHRANKIEKRGQGRNERHGHIEFDTFVKQYR